MRHGQVKRIIGVHFREVRKWALTEPHRCYHREDEIGANDLWSLSIFKQRWVVRWVDEVGWNDVRKSLAVNRACAWLHMFLLVDSLFSRKMDLRLHWKKIQGRTGISKPRVLMNGQLDGQQGPFYPFLCSLSIPCK